MSWRRAFQRSRNAARLLLSRRLFVLLCTITITITIMITRTRSANYCQVGDYFLAKLFHKLMMYHLVGATSQWLRFLQGSMLSEIASCWWRGKGKFLIVKERIFPGSKLDTFFSGSKLETSLQAQFRMWNCSRARMEQALSWSGGQAFDFFMWQCVGWQDTLGQPQEPRSCHFKF